MSRYSLLLVHFGKPQMHQTFPQGASEEEKGNPKFDPLLVKGNGNKFYIYAQTFKILTLKTH